MARIALLLACAMVSSSAMAAEFFPQVSGYIETSLAEFDRIPEDRRKALRKIAGYVRAQVESGQDARLNFICTHNSRRSHMSQLWAPDGGRIFRDRRREHLFRRNGGHRLQPPRGCRHAAGRVRGGESRPGRQPAVPRQERPRRSRP